MSSLRSAVTPTTADPDLQALLTATLAETAADGVVIALCAAWCGTCRDFAPGFQAVAAKHPRLVFRWLDIEDEAAALGDLDVETFPTLLIGGRDGSVRFVGPVLPQPAQIERPLRSLELA